MIKKNGFVLLLIILVIILLVLLFTTPNVPSAYQFPNQLGDIVSVELLYNQNESGEGTSENNIHLIKELDNIEIESFMSSIYSLETKRYSPPLYGWGCYIAKITYSNGDIEMLGSLHIEYIANNSTPTGTGAYYFTDDSFASVFSKYIDTEKFPRID